MELPPPKLLYVTTREGNCLTIPVVGSIPYVASSPELTTALEHQHRISLSVLAKKLGES